jgi:succinate dehydrogenase / fumarate reductase iron-sulfur subunit
MGNTFTLKIYRGMPKHQYWEEFEIELRPGLNIISCLMEIQKHPYTKQGKKVEPVVWEQGCLEEVCGSCSMLVNGKPRQSCTAIISVILETNGSKEITLAPLSKYPLVRDLVVDRSLMFDNLKKVHAWIDADEYGRGPGPTVSQSVQEVRYALSTCMTCGCCTESCPQINSNSKFVGPAIASQVRLFNAHPTGKLNRKDRLKPMLEEGGIGDCGNAQNCVQVCPKKIPLTDSIASVSRDASLEALRQFSFPDRE